MPKLSKNFNIKVAGTEEIDPELKELASNYGTHELDESGFNLIFGS